MKSYISCVLFVMFGLLLKNSNTFIIKSISPRSLILTRCLNTPRPEDIDIPQEKVELKYSRSSGAGGQNVNKVNTKVEIRFNVATADWIPSAVKDRMLQYNPTKITKEGDLVVTSQEHRTQGKNRQEALDKIREIISEAYVEPKDRHMWVGISEKGKEKRRDEKRARGAVKQNRKSSKSFDDYD